MNMLSNLRKRIPPRTLFALTAVFVVISAGAFLIEINIQTDFEGIYLLKGDEGKLVELRDSLYLGEAERLLARVETPRLHALINRLTPRSRSPHISCVWNDRRGHGYIHSQRPDGSELLICLSRFRDSLGRIPKGIFVGGEMPSTFYGDTGVRLNETGIAYRSGGRWYHIWCNANEGIAAGSDATRMIYPSEWTYRKSRILIDSNDEVAIESNHVTELENQPIAIDRFIYHRASDDHLILAIRFRNEGVRPTAFYYVYGDEPWVGTYGSSRGNVGWSPGKIHRHVSVVNPLEHNVAGFIDIGNDLLPDERGGQFTGLGNFLAWYGLVTPQLVYFSNREGEVHDESEGMLLESPQNRVIFAQWSIASLPPGQSRTIILALGILKPGSYTIPPRAPEISVPWERIKRAFPLD